MKSFLLAALVCVALAGCEDSPFSSGEQGFVSGDGNVTVLPAAEREKPQPITGETLDGEQVSLDEYAGKTVVIPVWGSWCGPCRKEAPMFAAAASDLAADGVAFLGINSRDNSVEAAQRFARNVGINYPSIYNPTGSLMLNFDTGLSPNSIPSVMFVDAEGRVAAAVLGEITRTTLYDVIEEIATGSTTGTGP